jgi:hypothetical protein
MASAWDLIGSSDRIKCTPNPRLAQRGCSKIGGHSQGARKTRAHSTVAAKATHFHRLCFSFLASCLQPFSFKDISPCRTAERHRAISNQARHLSPGQSGGHRIPPAPARTFWQARNETTSDISRLPKKKPGRGTPSRRRTTINMPNTITDRCRETETGHRRRIMRRGLPVRKSGSRPIGYSHTTSCITSWEAPRDVVPRWRASPENSSG